MEKTGDKIYPAYNELMRQAAQGDVVYNDDTTNRVLELITVVRNPFPLDAVELSKCHCITQGVALNVK
jgi:hypothetical protein